MKIRFSNLKCHFAVSLSKRKVVDKDGVYGEEFYKREFKLSIEFNRTENICKRVGSLTKFSSNIHYPVAIPINIVFFNHKMWLDW